MKSVLSIALLVTCAATTTVAFADEKALCIDAASKGQALRDEHKLVQARAQFIACARQECPSVVQQDCAAWLDEVEKSLPTVVLSASDPTGASRTDVKVSVDGKPFAASLEGRSIPIDPGTHTFHFEFADGTSVDRQVLVSQGQKDQPIVGALPRAVRPTATTSTAPTVPPSSGFPWRTTGWVVAGAGVAGIAVGGVLGLLAMGAKSDAQCNAQNQCQPGPLSNARGMALGADIGFIAGGVLVAGGLAMVLLGPRGSTGREGTATTVRIAPTVVANGSGVVLGGRW